MSSEQSATVGNKMLVLPGKRGGTSEGAPFLRKHITDLWSSNSKYLGLLLPFSLLVLWELVSRFQIVKPYFLPSPTTVALTFYDLAVHQRLHVDFMISAIAVLKGFILGGILGLLVGIASGLSKTVETLLGSTLNSIRQVPPIVWLPLVVLWAGAGDLGKTIVISKTVFFPVFLNTLQGIRGVPKEYIEVARVFEYSRALLLRRIILPSALPSIFVGIRYGAGVAWATIIAAEMLGGRYGLGYLLARAQEMLIAGELFVVIILIGLVGYTVDVALRKLEKYLLRWKRGYEG